MVAAGVLCLGCAPSTPPAAPVPPRTTSVSPVTSPAPSKIPSAPESAPSSPPTTKRATLPRGGREVFPRYRLVGYAGLTGAKTLGRLGEGSLEKRVVEMEQRAKPYAAGRQVLPVLEVIATVVQGSPGRDGRYRTRISDRQIETYLTSARKHKAILLLNIQPGRSTFMAEAKAYEKWLREPDVGLALDPEWAMGKGQVPGRVFGRTTGGTLDDVAEYLAAIVAKHDLPEKVLVYHQLAARIVTKESQLKDRRGVAMVKSVDGIGSPAQKRNTYRVVGKTTPDHVHAGFKLFFTEDKRGGRLMKPAEVLALRPRPEYVLFE